MIQLQPPNIIVFPALHSNDIKEASNFILSLKLDPKKLVSQLKYTKKSDHLINRFVYLTLQIKEVYRQKEIDEPQAKQILTDLQDYIVTLYTSGSDYLESEGSRRPILPKPAPGI